MTSCPTYIRHGLKAWPTKVGECWLSLGERGTGHGGLRPKRMAFRTRRKRNASDIERRNNTGQGDKEREQTLSRGPLTPFFIFSGPLRLTFVLFLLVHFLVLFLLNVRSLVGFASVGFQALGIVFSFYRSHRPPAILDEPKQRSRMCERENDDARRSQLRSAMYFPPSIWAFILKDPTNRRLCANDEVKQVGQGP